MFTLFQRTLIVVLAFGFLVVALVVAAKAPAQATTFAPALSLPVNAVIPPGIVTTGDATVKAKPDGAIVTVGTIAQEATADEAQAQLSGRIAKILDRAKAQAMATTARVQLGKVISVNDIGLTPTVDGAIKGAAFTALAIPAPAPVSQLPAGELQVVVRVQVQWELAP